MESCFPLHPEKRPSSKRKKILEAKIEALEERFKSLASSGQILDSPSSFGVQASSSTPDYYMIRASRKVVSSVAVSRATPSTTRKSVASLRAWNNAPADQIDQARLPLSFGLANAIQSVSGRHPSDEVLNLATDMVHTLASKMLYTPLFTTIEWSSPEFQPAKVFHFANRILEGKASSPSLTVAQATTDIPTSKDPNEVAKWRAKLPQTLLRLLTHTL